MAVYRVRGGKKEAEGLAREIAHEQTVEIPEELVEAGIREAAVGTVESVRPAPGGAFDVEIGYKPALSGNQIPQLLNLLYGNVSIQRGVRLMDFHIPPEALARFHGPNHGIVGVRAALGVFGRPLLATAIKPNGAPLERLATLARDFALGGGDIVKDDQNLAGETLAAFRERVARCQEAVEDANRGTGRRTLYCPILTAPQEEIEERIRFALGLGVRGFLVCPMLVGFDQTRLIAQKYRPVLIAHPSLTGTFYGRPDHGMGPGLLLGKLFRLLGADASIFPNHGGRFPFSKEECLDIARRLREEWPPILPALPVPAGGMRFENLSAMGEEYGQDSVFLIGGALLADPDGVERATGKFLAKIKEKFRERLKAPASTEAVSSCELPSSNGAPLSKAEHLVFENFRWRGRPAVEYKKSRELPFEGVARHELVGKDGLKTAFELRYFEIAPGGYTSLEKHAHTHTIVSLRGSGVLVKGDRRVAVKPLDIACVDSMETHQLRNEGSEPFGFLCIVDRDRDRPMKP